MTVSPCMIVKNSAVIFVRKKQDLVIPNPA